MSVAMYMQFPGTTTATYDKVVKAAHVKENPPAGLISHVAGSAEGNVYVVDVWESQAAFDRFFKERLQKAMETSGVKPVRPVTFNVHNMINQNAMARH